MAAYRRNHVGTTSAGEQPRLHPAGDSRTVLVITDLRIELLSPDGVTWPTVGETVTESHTV